MIDGLGKIVPPRIDAPQGPQIRRSAPVAGAPALSSGETATPSPAADLAAAGAPIDSDKVARIRTAIADGSFRIDADAVAGRMIADDLGPAGRDAK